MIDLKKQPASEKQVTLDLLKVAPGDVGGRIRAARQSKGLSLADLGKLVQRSSQAVQQWEVGQAEPGLARLLEMARHLGVDAFWLVFGVKARIDPDWEQRELKLAAMSEEDRFLETLDAPTDGPGEFAAAARKRQVGKLRGRRLQVIKRVEMMPDKMARENFANAASSGDIVSHFDCSEEAFAFEITTRRNAPHFELGDVVVIDRAQFAHPGAMVLAIGDEKLVFGQLSHNDDDGELELLAPNPLWPIIKLDKITGVMVEHTTPRSERAAWGAAAKPTE